MGYEQFTELRDLTSERLQRAFESRSFNRSGKSQGCELRLTGFKMCEVDGYGRGGNDGEFHQGRKIVPEALRD